MSENNKNWLWWDPPNESLPIEFCENTALHGLRYVGQPKRSTVERIFWLVAFLTGVIVACILITRVWRKYNEAPVMITFEDKVAGVSQIPFPAVTLCNVNNIRKDKAMEILRDGYSGTPEALEKVSLLHHVCAGSEVRFSQKFGYNANGSTIPKEFLRQIDEMGIHIENDTDHLNMTVKQFLEMNAQTCEDMILLCRWDNDIHECMELFQSIATDFGKCCTFNFIPQSLLHRYSSDTEEPELDLEGWMNSKLSTDELWASKTPDEFLEAHHHRLQKYPKRIKNAGQTHGLSLLVNPGVKDYFCTTADFVGLEILVHLSITTPHIVDFGSAIHPNGEVFIRVSPEIINAETSIYNFAVDKRNCYFDGEFELKYYNYYTLSNCIDECITNLTYEKCNCVKYHMPKESDQRVCGLASFRCVNYFEDEFTDQYLKGNCSKCLPTCNDVDYTVEVHSGPLRNDVDIWLQNETMRENWAELQVSIVHIFFGQHNSYPKIRKQLYGYADLIASTGGLLGLCLGFSALSLLEVIYFLTIRLCFTILRRRRFAEISIDVVEDRAQNELRQKIFYSKSNGNKNDSKSILPIMAAINPMIGPVTPLSGAGYNNLHFQQNEELLNLQRKHSKPIFYSELLTRGMLPPYRYRP